MDPTRAYHYAALAYWDRFSSRNILVGFIVSVISISQSGTLTFEGPKIFDISRIQCRKTAGSWRSRPGSRPFSPGSTGHFWSPGTPTACGQTWFHVKIQWGNDFYVVFMHCSNRVACARLHPGACAMPYWIAFYFLM